ncbi:LacI family DNA-binding transcriptional regulator [uncultured Pseudokineococcus sp.]|uniref:LacI family DNA-binding transcriptional regulator n=1 Tax=uncultured Pseudokineococcus sp. TaxID=1642928 RepID=UPI00260BD0DD|nr:LacI family DNA-binding transcriptional regulator [uncultured Pseudokineococcus sp.]
MTDTRSTPPAGGDAPAATPDRRSPVTLSDVARASGVSLATASRAVNGSARRVRPDLHARVLAAAAQLGYTANGPAQAMARGRTSVLGLVVQDIADPYFSTMAAGVVRGAEQRGLVVTIGTTGRDPAKEAQHVAALRGQRASAVVVVGSRTDDAAVQARLAEEVAAFEASGGRAVLVSQESLPVDTVVVENEQGAEALARALTERGHERFAVLAGPPGLLTARDRLAGFRAGAAAGGGRVVDDLVLHGDFTRDGGHAAMHRLLDAGFDRGCVLAVNDVMAVGAMAALRERGVDLPGAVAVAGFDDISTLRDVTPALTTVRLPLQEIGERAVELLLDEEGGGPRTVRVRGEVVLRASTPDLRRG